jgi:hypothetical protein
MAWYNEETPETLNFMVVGNYHSGHELLQAALSAHPNMVCHGGLLHSDAAVRQAAHEDYFGGSGRVPDWYQPYAISVEQYLTNKIFDNGLNGEKAIGVQLDYQSFIDGDLWEYVEQKCRCGDFCLLHVTRNPVACFVDQKQAEWRARMSEEAKFRLESGRMVCPDPAELSTFVRNHLANELKINRLCRDRAVIPYHELLLDFKSSLQQSVKFLGVPFSPACITNQKRINMKHTKSYIGNWTRLQAELPLDVLGSLQSPILF